MSDEHPKARKPSKVRIARDNLGLSQRDVAKQLGIDASTYSRHETRGGWTGQQLVVLSCVLGVPAADLLEGGTDSAPRAGSIKRTVEVYRLRGGEMSVAELVGEYAPTKNVPLEAFAVEIHDDAMVNPGSPRHSIAAGDWCVIDPSMTPTPRDIVLGSDPITGEEVVRVFIPLHPTNERAPGYILRAAQQGYDDIYVSTGAGGTSTIRGVVVEKRTLLK